MIPTLITTVLIVAAFCAYVARVQLALNALNAPLPDPSGDWWPQFERQFRQHVRQRAFDARHGHRPSRRPRR